MVSNRKRGSRKSEERLSRLKLWSPFMSRVDVVRNGAMYALGFASHWHTENMTDSNILFDSEGQRTNDFVETCSFWTTSRRSDFCYSPGTLWWQENLLKGINRCKTKPTFPLQDWKSRHLGSVPKSAVILNELQESKCLRYSSIQVASGPSPAAFFVNCLLTKIFLATAKSLTAGFYLIAML